MFNDERNFNDKEANYKQSYMEMSNLQNEKDLRITLTRIMDVCDFLHQKYITTKENDQTIDETDFRLTRKEENGNSYNNINILK